MRLFSILFISVLLASCGEQTPATAVVTDIDSLFKLYPDSVPVLVKHGNKLLERYDYDNALKDGAKAYRMDSNNVEARFLYANALNNRATRNLTDVGNAQRHFKYVLKKDPKNLKAHISLASTYSQQGDYEKSFKYINDALRIDKRYRDAYVMKGTNYLQLEKRDLAKSSYETAIQQDPNFYEAYLFLGTLYQQDLDPLCIEYFRSAAQLKPKSIDVLYALAYGLQNFNEEEEALSIYRKMTKMESTFTPSYFQQGWIKQFKQADLDSAMYFYEIALQKEPKYVEAWHNLGLCYKDKGKKTNALQCFAKAVKYNPDFFLARDEAAALSK